MTLTTQETINFFNRLLDDSILMIEEAKHHLSKLVALNPNQDQALLLGDIEVMEAFYEELFEQYEELLSEEMAYLMN